MKALQVEVRIEMARDEAGNALNRADRARHLLSGLTVCGRCGALYAVRNSQHYGCSNNRSQGVCSSDKFLIRKDLEVTITDALRQQWQELSRFEKIHAAAFAARATAPAAAEATLTGWRS